MTSEEAAALAERAARAGSAMGSAHTAIARGQRALVREQRRWRRIAGDDVTLGALAKFEEVLYRSTQTDNDELVRLMTPRLQDLLDEAADGYPRPDSLDEAAAEPPPPEHRGIHGLTHAPHGPTAGGAHRRRVVTRL